MGYFWRTRHEPLIISINEDGEACTCAYGSCTVHTEDKGLSLLLLTMCRGATMRVLIKLVIATTSSTEIEVAADREPEVCLVPSFKTIPRQ